MAGEKKGKAYEAFVALALKMLRKKRIFTGEIYWDEMPEEMTIKPDLTIGENKDSPHTFLLITHSGSAKESEKKGWRNMGELAEAKVCLPEPPRVFNIAFDSVIKENLKIAQKASFDGQLIVGDLNYGPNLQGWIDENLSRVPKDKDEKVEFLKSEAKVDKVLKSLLDKFSLDLKKLLKMKASVVLDNLWKMERKRQVKRTTRVPRARNTFVRRGLSKLLIFEDIDLAIKIFSGERLKINQIPEYAFELGLVGKAVGRAKPMDVEVANAISLLRPKDVSTIVNDAPQDKMFRWVYPLRNLGEIQHIHDFISRNWTGLKNPKQMLDLLRLVNEKPEKVVPGKVTSNVNWFYFFLVDLLKANSGNNQSFGYAQMLRKIKANKKQIDHFLLKEGLPSLKLRGQSFIVRGLTDWLSRLDTVQAKGFGIPFQAAVAYILSKEISEQSSIPDWEEIKKVSIKTNLEQKLVTYRYFEPLRTLITDKICGREKKITSCFGQRAKLLKGSAQTTILKKNKTLINWQSAHSSHTNDKKKELCGRAVAIRYSWDSKTNKFIKSPGIEKLILVVDGTWSRKDLKAMARAGWDEIYYPNEMDELAKAIV